MKTFLALFLLVIYSHAAAQVFPIQVSSQLVPPYSPFLSDYTAPGAQNLIVQISANDISLSGYSCKLRITIEGVGITIRTNPNFNVRPLMLEGGTMTQHFYGEDLYEYFHPDALEFTGFTREEYRRRARLPEGVYRFTVEVLDYNRGTVVSNQGMATAWIILNDPPILNLPSNFARIQVQDPTNILFTWTPRHGASPNAAFTTEYTFRLTEIWPDNRNPNDAILTTAPLFEFTTAHNQILYGINEPALIPGRKYAWQVEARDTEGRDLFNNNGRSQVFVFQYGDALPVPENFLLRWAKPTTLSMRWDAVASDDEEVRYRLQYRPRRRRENHQWYETVTRFTEKTLYHLESNTDYEMKVRAEKISQESEYSEISIFKTLPPAKEEFVCKDPLTPPPAPANTLPVFPLSINDTLHAGGYNILVRDVMVTGSKYYGSGVAIVPWLNGAKVRVTFEDIRVNDRFWLTSGTVKSVWSAQSKFLFEEQSPILPGTAPQAGELAITVVAVDTLITVTGIAIATVTLDEQGNIVVETTDGNQQTLPKGESYAITDDVGNGYVIDKQGNIAKTTATEARAAAARGDRNYDLKFRFAPGDGQYGFDERRHDALAAYYQEMANGEAVAWKALSSATPDALEGFLDASAGDIPIEKIRFAAGPTPVVATSIPPRTAKLQLQGKFAGTEEELLALYSPADTMPDKVLGKINLVTYDPIHYKLEIVPVNGAALPDGLSQAVIGQKLNALFSQAVVTWQVNLSQGFDVDLPEKFDEGGSGVFSNYTSDMKKVLGAWNMQHDDTYYLFLIDEPKDPSTLGYMPRNKQAGFVFVKPHQGNTALFLKTLAHELGHGAFNLEHTFSEHNLPPASTDNLMDYSDGTLLYKYQWDRIHEPNAVIGLFEGDDEGGSVVVSDMTQLKSFANPDGSFTFLAPTGIPFTLPATTQSVKFWTNDVYPDNVIPVDESPDGALISFTIDNQTYRYHKISGKTTGSGYKVGAGEFPFIDKQSKDQNGVHHAIVGLPCLERGVLKFIAKKLRFNSTLPSENYSAAGTVVSALPTEDPYRLDYSTASVFLDANLDFTYTDEALSFINDNEACLNEMVHYVIKGADVIQRNPGYYARYKGCNSYSIKYPAAGETETEKAWLLGLYYEKLKAFPAEFLRYVHESQYGWQNLLNIDDPDTLGELLKNSCESDFSLFSFEQREHIITVLSAGNLHDYWLGLGNNQENIVVYAIRQTPPDQHADLLELLSGNHYLLLKTLITKCDNQLVGQDNFDRLIDAITVMIQKTSVYENFEDDIEHDRLIRWGNHDLFGHFTYDCDGWIENENTSDITFSSSYMEHHYPGGGEVTGVRITTTETQYPAVAVSPFDFVTLRLYDDIVLDNGTSILKRSVAEFQAVPAIYLYWMIQRKATDETLAHLRMSVNLALFAVGGAEIIAARSGLRLTLAIMDQTLFAATFVLAAGPRQALEEGPNGEEWASIFKAFDAFNLLYGTARLGQGLSLAATDLLAKRALFNQLKEAHDWTSLSPSQQNALSAAFAKMDDGMERLEWVSAARKISAEVSSIRSVLANLSDKLQKRIALLPEKQIKDLCFDLSQSSDLTENLTLELIDGWEVLANHSILRKDPANLEILGRWVQGGVDKSKLSEGIRKSRDKQKLIEKISKADNRFYVQVLIKDYENIPGVTKGRYIPNSSSLSDKAKLPPGWEGKFDPPLSAIKSFTGPIEALELRTGDKIYRVSSFSKIPGSYWTRFKPESLEGVIHGIRSQTKVE